MGDLGFKNTRSSSIDTSEAVETPVPEGAPKPVGAPDLAEPPRAAPTPRAHERFAVTIPASVMMQDGTFAACIIRDISVMGARLAIARRHRVEANFRLQIASFAQPFPMRRIWQEGDFVGAMLDLPATERTVADTFKAIAPPTSPSQSAHRPSFSAR